MAEEAPSVSPTRRRLLLLAPAAVLAVGLAGAGAWLLSAEEPPVPIGGPFRLQDGTGRTVTEQDFRGRWTLVYFGYTHCPDACPMALQNMANAMDLLPPGLRERVALLFITVDPERDTPAVVRDYVSAFHAPITGLSGTPEQVVQVLRAYRVYAAKAPGKEGDYTVDHSSILYVMDPRGRFAANLTHEAPPERIAERLKALAG